VKKVILDSWAKLNLYLKVIDKREDNYHNLESLFERIKLSDKILLTLRNDRLITFSCTSKEVPHDSSNLGFKAAELLQKKYKIQKGVDIHIIKRIPVGSGMGGGSSNAATVLMGLNRLWGLKLNVKQLAFCAAKIGSDVPFFVHDTAFALVKGRGEKVQPLKELKNKKFWHVLIIPRVKISTPLIYKKWDEAVQGAKERLTIPKPNVKMLVSALKAGNFSLISKNLLNSLENVTFLEYPEVNRVKEKLARLGQKIVLMSGSGSTVFCLIPSRREGLKLLKQLKDDRFAQVFLTQTR